RLGGRRRPRDEAGDARTRHDEGAAHDFFALRLTGFAAAFLDGFFALAGSDEANASAWPMRFFSALSSSSSLGGATTNCFIGRPFIGSNSLAPPSRSWSRVLSSR